MKKKKKTELHVYDEEPFKTVCPERGILGNYQPFSSYFLEQKLLWQICYTYLRFIIYYKKKI